MIRLCKNNHLINTRTCGICRRPAEAELGGRREPVPTEHRRGAYKLRKTLPFPVAHPNPRKGQRRGPGRTRAKFYSAGDISKPPRLNFGRI